MAVVPVVSTPNFLLDRVKRNKKQLCPKHLFLDWSFLKFKALTLIFCFYTFFVTVLINLVFLLHLFLVNFVVVNASHLVGSFSKLF
jgi:hypothetical protein